MMNSDSSCNSGDHGRDPFELAVEAHQSGRLAEAERHYRRILVEQPDDPVVRQLLGVALLDVGRVDDALSELERSKELDPTDLLTLTQLGRAMFVAGRLRDAAAAWDQVWSTERELLVEMVPFHARALLDGGRFADAVAVASESLASDPGREEWRALLLEVLSPAPEASIVEAALQTIDDRGAPSVIPWILTEVALRWVADGRSDLAIQCLQARHETATDPVLARLLGGLLCQVGRLEDAIAPLESSLALDPRDVECAVNLGAALAGLGRLDAAESVLSRACDLDPSRPEPRLNLAQVLIRTGRAESAVALLEETRRGHPDRWDATLIHASAFQKLGRDGEASRVLDDAIARGVRHPSLVLERSILATKLGERELAESLLRGAMARPDAPDSVRLRLLDLLLESGRAEEVLALTLSDSFAEGRPDALVRIASAWSRLGRHDQAKLAADEALATRPRELSSWFMLGWRFLQHRDPDRAIECLQEVLARDPNNGQARVNLAGVLMRSGRLEESLRTLPDRPSAGDIGASELATRAMSQLLLGELRGAAEATEALLEGGLYPDAASRVLMTWNYPSGVDEGWLAALHRRWGRSLSERSPGPSASPPARLPDRPLRVGLVSGDFRQHSVASFLESWLPEGPLAGLGLVCFSNVEEPDDVTQRLRGLTPEWHEVSGLDDDGFAELVRSSDLDALVDLSGHTSLSRLQAFRLQPAPCLVSWLGYPNTTGLESVDFRLVDDLTDPPDQPWDGPERLLRMEAPFLCFHPSPDSPLIRVPTDRPPTFGSFNNAFKLNRSTLDSWARAISAIPEARLVLKARQFQSQELRNRVLATLQSGGLDAPRVDILVDLPSQHEHLVAYNEVDFALDPFPYHGATTTCEALWMGVPVLTRIGAVHRSRVGLTLLRSVGIDWSIANSEEEFHRLASLAARDVRVHRANRAALRDQVARSELCDPRSFARRFSEAIRLAVKTRTPRRS